MNLKLGAYLKRQREGRNRLSENTVKCCYILPVLPLDLKYKANRLDLDWSLGTI